MFTSKRLVPWAMFVALLFLVGIAVPAIGAPLSADDLVKLVELQIGDDAIVAKVQKDGIAFSMDDPLKRRLKGAGATEHVFAALEKAGSAAATGAGKTGTTPIMVWVQRQYGHVENPLYSEFSVNGKLVDIFTSDTRKEIGKHLQIGWNTIAVKTTPQQNVSDSNELIFRIGAVSKDPKSDHLVMKPTLWQLRNGTDWKFRDGKFTYRLNPGMKEVTLTYRVYFAGLNLEQNAAGNGDYVLQAKPEYGHVNSPLTLTVFVNGTPVSSFLGQERQVVITPLLKEGKNDFKLVSSRVKDAMDDNDIKAEVIGPLRYNPHRERFEGKPIVEFKAWQGWERDKESGQLVSKANREADSIERTAAFMLDETPQVGRKLGTEIVPR